MANLTYRISGATAPTSTTVKSVGLLNSEIDGNFKSLDDAKYEKTGGTISGDVIITGNLSVNGSSTTINTNNLTVDDKNIEIGSVVAVTGIVGTISSTATTTTVTGIATTAGLIPGMALTKSAGLGVFGTSAIITSVDSSTQITITASSANAIGSLTFDAGGATDATANGGGITLRGTTDKSIIWDSTNSNWTSSENWNIATGKTYKINNTSVLSSTTLGSTVTASSLTSVGTLNNLTVVNTISGSISGNAATVTTNANLTGMVTSVGNATTVVTNANLTGMVTSVGNATTVVTNANLTGDITSVGNATTLATVNSNVGSYGSSTQIPSLTVNAKGLVTAISNNNITVGDGTLTVSAVTAADTNNTVTLALSGAYSANSTTARSLDLKVGPALTNLATFMTTATAGFIRRSGQDTYSIDTNTYSLSSHSHYIGTTAVQAASAAQAVTGITALSSPASTNLVIKSADSTAATSGNVTISTGTGNTIGLLSIRGGDSESSTAGGSISIIGGLGGTASSTGGNITIKGGNGGTTNGSGGSIYIDAGALIGGGSDGTISIGTNNSNSVFIAKSGVTTTISGHVSIAGSTVKLPGIGTSGLLRLGALGALSADTTTYLTASDTLYIGTTSIALGRTTGAQTLSGVSIDGSSTSVVGAVAAGSAEYDILTAGMASNDSFRIRVGGTAVDSGWVELSTGDNGSEPIYVRQYSADSIARTATLLDASGNTSFPGSFSASNFSGSSSGTNTGDQVIPTSLPASDVYAWAKEATKPTYTAAEVGLGNVNNTADSVKSVNYATTAGSAPASSIESTILGSGTANSTTYLRGDRTWATIIAGATLSNDTTTNATYYPGMASGTSGSWTTAYVSSTKLSFNPSTGTLNSTAFNSLSDARQKSDIQLIENALDKTLSLNGYTFTLNSNKDKRQTGVIAQEVLKVLPEAVSGSEDTTYSVAYGNMIGLMIEAIKELNAKVADLQNQLANK